MCRCWHHKLYFPCCYPLMGNQQVNHDCQSPIHNNTVQLTIWSSTTTIRAHHYHPMFSRTREHYTFRFLWSQLKIKGCWARWSRRQYDHLYAQRAPWTPVSTALGHHGQCGFHQGVQGQKYRAGPKSGTQDVLPGQPWGGRGCTAVFMVWIWVLSNNSYYNLYLSSM